MVRLLNNSPIGKLQIEINEIISCINPYNGFVRNNIKFIILCSKSYLSKPTIYRKKNMAS